jgi:hypothetical protein
VVAAASAWITIRPERRALLCCARVDLDAGSREELRSIVAGGIDLQTLVREARREGLIPLVSRHIRELAPNGARSDILRDVGAEARANVFTSLTAAGELVAVISALRRIGVSAIAIKGPVSAELCYGDLGLRTFGDLDLLISPSEVPAVWAYLEEHGYLPRFALSTASRARLLRSHSELAFSTADGQRQIDLHWSLLPQGHSFTPGDDGPFARRSAIRLGASEVPTLGLEATLLFLLLHGMKHQWQSLLWLTDVGELLRRHGELDWNEVMLWSAHPGRKRLVDVGLALVNALLGAPVPKWVLARGQSSPAVATITEAMARKLLLEPSSGQLGRLDAIFRLQYLRGMERATDRLRFLHNAVLRPTPLEWQTVPLPPSLAPLYYLVRPLRLFWKYARGTRSAATVASSSP